MKFFDDHILTSLILRNWVTISLLANIVVLVVSLFYFELPTALATISVTGFFILSKLNSLKNSIQLQTFSLHPFLLQQRYAEAPIGILFFIFCMLHSLVFISVISIVQRVFFRNEGSYITSILDSHMFISCLGIILFLFFVAHDTVNALEKYDQPSIKDQKQKIIDSYHLDPQKTCCFVMNSKIIGFMVGQHSFEVDLGLKIGKREYKPATVLEYLHIAGIGFKDLDEGHIKNIEMYSIGS